MSVKSLKGTANIDANISLGKNGLNVEDKLLNLMSKKGIYIDDDYIIRFKTENETDTGCEVLDILEVLRDRLNETDEDKKVLLSINKAIKELKE